ncbi:MAG: hypothetical protein J6W96_01825 [Alphaproteobacteria bacterium]|nr:hypothetical protein [Alphaproteobacteria bacterium]
MKFLNLIKDGKHQAILDYIKNSPHLASYEEYALIERGNSDEIMMCIAYHSLDRVAFEAFLKRGKLNEIRFYLACNRTIYNDILLLDIGKGIINEYIDYLIRNAQQYDEPSLVNIQIKLILMDDHCALRRYICQVKLEPQALKMLRQRGSKVDNLVYDLRWKSPLPY